MKQKVMKLPQAVVVIIGVFILAGFLIVMNLVGRVAAEIPAFLSGYTLQFISEVGAAVYSLLLLAAFGYLRVLKEKGEGFVKGFYSGGFMTGYCVIMVIAQLIVQQTVPDNTLVSPGQIVIFTLTVFLVGFNEEILVRGIILNLFLDRFANTRRGMLSAIVLSSLIFGCAHLPNVLSGVPLGSALIQSVQATLLGVIFAAAYLRSGNLWITIILHAVTDFAGLMASGLYGNGTMVDGIGSLSVINLVVTVPLFLIPCIVLLRPGKLDGIIAARGGNPLPPTAEDAESMAVTSLILGVFGLLMSCAGHGARFAVVRLLGAVSSKKIKPHQSGIATAGLVTSIVGLVIALAVVVLMLLVLPLLGMDDLMSIL